MSKEKQKLLKMINSLVMRMEKEELVHIKQEYRQAFQIGELSALDTLKDIIEWELI